MEQNIRFILSTVDHLCCEEHERNAFIAHLRTADVESLKYTQKLVVSETVQFIAHLHQNDSPQGSLLASYLNAVDVFFKRTQCQALPPSTNKDADANQTPKSVNMSYNDLSPYVDVKKNKTQSFIQESCLSDLVECYDVLEGEYLQMSSSQHLKDLAIRHKNEEILAKSKEIEKLTADVEKWKKEAEMLRREQIWMEEKCEEKDRLIQRLKKESKKRNGVKKLMNLF